MVRMILVGLFFCCLLTTALVFSLFGEGAGTFAAVLAAAVLITSSMVANARASLAGVAAFAGREHARQAGWALGEGHTTAIVVQRLTASALWMAVALPLGGGWWLLDQALARPSFLLGPTLPDAPAAWAMFALEGAPLAIIVAFLAAFAAAVGSTASALTWQALGGEREVARRRSVFEA
ncbi:MAG: hypothetical protein JWR84_2674 [Caulobacter sp.]|nr:hypothetical protein [Caulobacter sp.]